MTPPPSAPTTSRLWPVLTTLVALPLGAAVIERVALVREGTAKVIVVEAEKSAGDDVLPDQAPVDEAHTRARELLRRGDGSGALDAYHALAQGHPQSAAIALEHGLALLAQRKLADAVTELQRARTLAPNDERVLVALARAHARGKDHAAAEVELRRALTLHPGYGSALLALGRALDAQGKKKEALETFTQASAFGSNEDRAAGLVAPGAALLDAERDDEARTAFDRAIERAPARVEVRVNIARAYLSTDDKADAVRASGVLATAADIAPDLPDVQTLIGQAREAQDDLDGAEEAYWQAIRMAPQATTPRRRLLRLALARQRFAKAEQQADALLDIDADEPEHHLLRGLVAARQKNAPLARERYQTAIDKAHGDYPEAWFNLGALEKDAGKLDAAVAAYEKAIALRPGYHAAENNLGLTLIAAGKLDAAEQRYREVLARAPSYAPGWVNLGKLYSQRKMYPQAIDAYRKALEVKPDYARALLDLGVAYARSGRLDEAAATYKRALELNPRSVAAWYNLGLAQRQTRDLPAAEQSFRQARELDQDHAASGKKLAQLVLARGAVDEARALLEDVLDTDPNDAEARLQHAELLQKAGDLAGCAREVAVARHALAEGGADAVAGDGTDLAALASSLAEQCGGNP
ncbi:MAG: tetratricopeptide repeat protein [Deltaproteobacteria bacterium]|nr:tetratricopeptide repeat protein [Deltaproteobacteria bacterium]